MIKIRYRGANELSPGLHAAAERRGRTTTVYLLSGLTPAERRSALRRLRLSARMGYCPKLPAAQLALALLADRVRTGFGQAGAVFRVHPAGSTLPVMLLSGGAIAFLLLSTVSIHVLREPRGHGPQPDPGVAPVASAGAVPISGSVRQGGTANEASGAGGSSLVTTPALDSAAVGSGAALGVSSPAALAAAGSTGTPVGGATSAGVISTGSANRSDVTTSTGTSGSGTGTSGTSGSSTGSGTGTGTTGSSGSSGVGVNVGASAGSTSVSVGVGVGETGGNTGSGRTGSGTIGSGTTGSTGGVNANVGSAVNTSVNANVGSSVNTNVGSSVNANVKANVGSAVNANVNANVGSAVGASVSANSGSGVNASVNVGSGSSSSSSSSAPAPLVSASAGGSGACVGVAKLGVCASL
jgi:hypothetical protein